MSWNYHYSPIRGTVGKTIRMTPQQREVKDTEFRIELFLSCEPWRLQFRAGGETIFRYDDACLRLRQQDQFMGILQRVGTILPPNCLNLGLQAAMRGEVFSYTGVSALEEEITWHLFQRLRR